MVRYWYDIRSSVQLSERRISGRILLSHQSQIKISNSHKITINCTAEQEFGLAARIVHSDVPRWAFGINIVVSSHITEKIDVFTNLPSNYLVLTAANIDPDANDSEVLKPSNSHGVPHATQPSHTSETHGRNCPPFFYEYMPIPFEMHLIRDHLKEMGSFKKGEQRHVHGQNHHGCISC
jgi:hypothetical protein